MAGCGLNPICWAEAARNSGADIAGRAAQNATEAVTPHVPGGNLIQGAVDGAIWLSDPGNVMFGLMIMIIATLVCGLLTSAAVSSPTGQAVVTVVNHQRDRAIKVGSLAGGPSTAAVGAAGSRTASRGSGGRQAVSGAPRGSLGPSRATHTATGNPEVIDRHGKPVTSVTVCCLNVLDGKALIEGRYGQQVWVNGGNDSCDIDPTLTHLTLNKGGWKR